MGIRRNGVLAIDHLDRRVFGRPVAAQMASMDLSQAEKAVRSASNRRRIIASERSGTSDADIPGL